MKAVQILSVVLALTFAAPTGAQQISAVESGFNPAVDAFSFENYGSDAGYKDLTPMEMVRLFGPGVCASKQGGACVLSPVAKQWMNQTNTAMNGGHCEGMAVLSALFYTRKLNPTDFGASSVKNLSIEGNDKLQHEIAVWWATQATSPSRDAVLKASPKAIVATLSKALKLGANAPETYSIGIYKRDGSDGHAVTPYAVRDKGNGVWAIVVYDNNYPNKEREIKVDVEADTWSYTASINPGVEAAEYEGDAETQTLDLTPSPPRLQAQSCPFCQPTTNGASAPKPAMRYNEVYIEGDGVRALITDEQGHRLGRIGNKLINEIPGALAQDPKNAVQQWAQDEDPIYLVPQGIKFTVTLDGAALKKAAVAQFSMIGPGYSLDIEDIQIKPGQKDSLKVSPDGKQLSYTPGQGESPDIVLAVEGENMDHEFYIKGFDLESGGSVNLKLDVDKGQLQLNTIGNKKAGSYDLVVTRYEEDGTQEFGGTFDLEPSDTIYANYLKWQGNGKPMTVQIDYKSDGTIDETSELKDTEE